MNIKYVFNPNTLATGAVAAKYDGSFAEGIDPMIAWGLSERGYVKESDMSPVNTTHAWAKPKDGVDKFDEAKGREIARDKLLVAYYSKLSRKHDMYVAALEKELARAVRNADYIKQKKANAESRLEEY